MKRMARFLARTAAGTVLIALAIASSPAQAVPINSKFNLPFDEGPQAYGADLVNDYGYIAKPFRIGNDGFVTGDGASRKINWSPDTVLKFRSAIGLRIFYTPTGPAIAFTAPTSGISPRVR